MGNIVNSLNLNKTPSLVQSNSLIFAKNIRLDVDGTIHRDYGITPLSVVNTSTGIIKYTNIFERINDDVEEINQIKSIVNGTKIVGIISNNNDFYLLIYTPRYTTEDGQIINSASYIFKYDERLDSFSRCLCNWNYSGGIITGNIVTNIRGDIILNICETPKSSNNNLNIPFKSINLKYSSLDDNESIYTQTPEVPIINFNFNSLINCTIPNGTYQFFVRYKIRDNFYTDWFPASKEMFAGNSNIVNTSFGTVKYVNTKTDSDISFKFDIQQINNNKFNKAYKSFQVGFILSHDEEIVARAWKHFPMDSIGKQFIFDYNEDAEEIEVTDLTNITYQLYNVENVTYFKNKQYISNYNETNFGRKYEIYDDSNAEHKNVEIACKNLIYDLTETHYKGNELVNNFIWHIWPVNGHTIYYDSLKIADINNTIIPFTSLNDDSIFNRLFYTGPNDNYTSYKNLKIVLESALKLDPIPDSDSYSEHHPASKTDDLWGISCTIDRHAFNENSIKDYILSINNNSFNREQIKEISPVNSFKNISKVRISVGSFSTKVSKRQELSIPFYNLDDENKVIDKDLGINNLDSIINKILKGYANDSKTRGLCKLPVVIDEKGTLNIHSITKGNNINLEHEYLCIEIYYRITYKVLYGATLGSEVPLDVPHSIQLRFFTDTKKVDSITKDELNIQSLIPYQSYNFYVHYVRNNGEITDGYLLNKNPIVCPYSPSADNIYYPVFNNINVPDDYDSWFVSIESISKNVGTLFKGMINTNYEYQSLDINLGLIRVSKKLNIIQQNDNNDRIQKLGKYYFSSDTELAKYLGSVGIIKFNNADNDINNENLAYTIRDYEPSRDKILELIKCTPYINKEYTSTDVDRYAVNGDLHNDSKHEFCFKLYKDYNLLGYICKVYPLNVQRTINYYTDGSSTVFSKAVGNPYIYDGDGLALSEIKGGIGISFNPGVYIYSNYNLNYLSLSENFKEVYKTGDNNITSLNRFFSSLNMSLVYTLPSMYKLYTRKTYRQYDEDNVYIEKFNNTIRSSILEGDENSINLIKFNATDYYNVPTDKGKITKLLGIGDAILVHTEDSIYKFSGNNTISAAEGEVLTTENDPFDTGIHELFGSNYGFAGLQDKTNSVVCENAYIFYDKDSNIIYMYTGNAQIEKINYNIEKLFRYKEIKSIHFANDYYNNRIFICIEFSDETKATLSYDIFKKTFVSLHDFVFTESFTTKTNCYFITDDKTDICYINKDSDKLSCYSNLYFNDDLYPSIPISKSLHVKSYNTEIITPIELHPYKSIIDIIINTNYESIKTLNAIHWISRNVDSEFKKINSNDLNTLKLADVFTLEHACDSIRIYTDTCISELINLKNISNNNPINDIGNYENVRYNQGRWTLNYFRNIQNSNNNINSYISDENSLIEGKYFVVRFIFSSDFKLESLSLNYNNKL